MKKLFGSFLFSIILLCILQGSLYCQSGSREKVITANYSLKNDNTQTVLPGYTKAVLGTDFTYHSPLPNVTKALLVRADGINRAIEWKSVPVQKSSGGDVTFILLAGINANAESRTFTLFVDDERLLDFNNPSRTDKREFLWRGDKGVSLAFKTVMVDKYDDLFGFFFITIPAGKLSEHRSARFKISGEHAGSRCWVMVFKYPLRQSVRVSDNLFVLKRDGKKYQSIKAEFIHLVGPASAEITFGNWKKTADVRRGYTTVTLLIPMDELNGNIDLSVTMNGETVMNTEFKTKKPEIDEIHLLHSSHVDIGFTHIQSECEQRHWNNLERAIEYAERSKDNAPGERFIWNAEALWALESYLDKHTGKKREAMIRAIRNGSIYPDAFFANMLTGLCKPEELIHIFDSARKIAKICGIKIDAGMITDIPGYTWGLVPAMAASGIKYVSIGTNTFDRIGHVLEEWGDKPFYWESPSGKERALCFIAGRGYSWFHSELTTVDITYRLNETDIFEYLNELKQKNYPYGIVPIRYNIGADNGPPDDRIADYVKAWNNKYDSPRLVLSSTSAFLHKFEEQYGSRLPVYRGDFTGCWEDGAASTAKETARYRNASERLVQAEALFAMYHDRDYPAEDFYRAWHNVLLFSEHTWGAHTSVSEPEIDFTKAQWKQKVKFLESAENSANRLFEAGLPEYSDAGKPVAAVDVINTNSWSRTGIVTINNNMKLSGYFVIDGSGSRVCSQRLSTGELVFLAENVPPFGAKRYYFKDTGEQMDNSLSVSPDKISNGLITVKIDTETGAIEEITSRHAEGNLVNNKSGRGLNDYFYVEGRLPENVKQNGKVKISVLEQGPLAGSVLIESSAPGCNGLKRIVTLYHGIDRIDITNIVDKKNTYEREGMHFLYPFNIPGGQMRIDAAWGYFAPETEQIPGANRNFYTIRRWLDISNNEQGVVWTAVDAPLLEIDRITNDPNETGWLRSIKPHQKFYSYVMNNYWNTNFKASQDGIAVFRYSLYPHAGGFDPVFAGKAGAERCQPLIAAPAGPQMPNKESLFTLSGKYSIVSSLKPSADNKALVCRVYNPGPNDDRVSLNWNTFRPGSVFFSSPAEEEGAAAELPVNVPAMGFITLRLQK